MPTAIRQLMSFAITFLFLLFLSCNGEITSSSSSSSVISSRTLDSFGNYIQLSHAKEATTTGRPVVVAVVEDSSSSSSFIVAISFGKSPVLRKIQLPLSMEEKDTSSSSPFIACCFTGVKGDANWLLQQIREYFSQVWERYDMATQLSTPTIAHVIARLLGRFAAQSEEHEWQSALGLPGKNDREDRTRHSSWGRPLGVQTMILSSQLSSSSTLSSRFQAKGPGLLLVEPSGRILHPLAKSKSGLVSVAAMGKESDKIQSRLLRLFQVKQKGKNNIDPIISLSDNDEDSMSTSTSSWEELPPTLEICRDTLIRVLIEEATHNNGNKNSRNEKQETTDNIMVETFSSNRGQIERSLYRYENSNNFYLVSS